MRNEQKKLEEYMYLSLIAKNYGTHTIDDKKFVCFTRSYGRTSKDEVLPVYLTSADLDNDKILLRRITNFEQKIFGNLKGKTKFFNKLNNITADENSKDSVCFVKRMREFLSSLKDEDKPFALENYRKNLKQLESQELINAEELRIMDEYATEMASKSIENNEELNNI